MEQTFPASTPSWSPPPHISVQDQQQKETPEASLLSFIQNQEETKRPEPPLPTPVQSQEGKQNPEIWRASSKPTASEDPSTSPSAHMAPLEKGDLLMITASAGTNKFLGIPNIKNMVYENRMTYANKWGE